MVKTYEIMTKAETAQAEEVLREMGYSPGLQGRNLLDFRRGDFSAEVGRPEGYQTKDYAQCFKEDHRFVGGPRSLIGIISISEDYLGAKMETIRVLNALSEKYKSHAYELTLDENEEVVAAKTIGQ